MDAASGDDVGAGALGVAVTGERMRELLEPYDPGLSEQLAGKLLLYLELLVKWNGRTNLSAIRAPEEMVRRHFGESLFAARHVPRCATLLDLGSGAGFPGLPIALARPEIAVTLAESQGKKAAFLREAARTLGVQVEVWGDRAERLPAERRFGVVTLRAVDDPALALRLARERVVEGGVLLQMMTAEDNQRLEGDVLIPGTRSGVLRMECVPRGTY